MKLPSWITLDDWDTVVEKSLQYGVNPALILAIGYHETKWGQLGWGRLGFHLGVGCFNESEADYHFQGLDRQVDWACQRIREFLPFRPTLAQIKKFCQKVWRPANCTSWAGSVYKIFSDLLDKNFPEFLTYDKVPDWAIQPVYQLWKRGFLNFPWGTHTFYRILTIIYNIHFKERR